MSYEKEDHDLQLKQNLEIKENTRLTKLALWVAIIGVILQVTAQYLWR